VSASGPRPEGLPIGCLLEVRVSRRRVPAGHLHGRVGCIRQSQLSEGVSGPRFESFAGKQGVCRYRFVLLTYLGRGLLEVIEVEAVDIA